MSKSKEHIFLNIMRNIPENEWWKPIKLAKKMTDLGRLVGVVDINRMASKLLSQKLVCCTVGDEDIDMAFTTPSWPRVLKEEITEIEYRWGEFMWTSTRELRENIDSKNIKTLDQRVKELEIENEKLHEIVSILNTKVDKLWYAPGMPGSIDAHNHFNKKNARLKK